MVELGGPGLPGVDPIEGAALGEDLLLQDGEKGPRRLVGNRLAKPLFGEVPALLILPGLLGPPGQCPPGHILHIEAVAGGEQLVRQLLVSDFPEVCLLAVEVPPVPLHLTVLFALYPLAFAVAVEHFPGQAVPGDDPPILVEHARIGGPAGPVHGPVDAPDLLLEVLGAWRQLHQSNCLVGTVG